MTPLAPEEVSTLVITAPVQLLIVEHSIDDVELILLELKKAGVQIHHITVEDKDQFHAALGKQTFDAVLCDYRLPTWTGMDVLRELRAVDKDTPFLLVTGTLGEEAAVECIKQGVSDFVLKHHMTRLALVLQRAIAEKKMQRECQNGGSAAALRSAESRLGGAIHSGDLPRGCRRDNGRLQPGAAEDYRLHGAGVAGDEF